MSTVKRWALALVLAAFATAFCIFILTPGMADVHTSQDDACYKSGGNWNYWTRECNAP